MLAARSLQTALPCSSWTQLRLSRAGLLQLGPCSRLSTQGCLLQFHSEGADCVLTLLFSRAIATSLFTRFPDGSVAGRGMPVLEIALKCNDGIWLPEKLNTWWGDPLFACPLPQVRCITSCYGGLMVFVKTWVGNTAFNGEFLPRGNQSKGRLWLRIIRLPSWHSLALLRTE